MQIKYHAGQPVFGKVEVSSSHLPRKGGPAWQLTVYQELSSL